MKNIYQDDSYNPGSEDIFSKPGQPLNTDTPEKPASSIGADFTEDVQMPAPQKAVRSHRQAPPPIKRTAPAVNPNQMPAPQPGSYYGSDNPYVQQPYYPQPVYYPINGQQPYPVYIPGQPYPVYPQGMPYPPQPYAQQVPAYGQPPVQPQAVPYPPAQQPVTPPAPTDPLSREAGTRVLFQSPDFDRKDEAADTDGYETLPHSYAAAPAFDVSEVELPSRKRAGAPAKPSDSFKIDEMEIGTYELGAMTVSRRAKATDIKAPSTEAQEVRPLPETVDDTPDEQEYMYDLSDEADDGDTPEAGTPEVDASESEEAAEAAAQAEQSAGQSKKEKKKLSPSEKIRRLILAVSAIAIVVSLLMLYNEYRLHEKNEQAMSNVSDLIITEPVTEPTTEAATAPSVPGQEGSTKAPTTTKPTTTRYLTPSEQFELLKQQNPDIVFPANIQLKYAKLYAENQDFVGYLSAENTDIDFPIVQGEDDEEYIEKDFFGEYTKYGCPFMASANSKDTLDMNTVIYGHHMRDGSLFAALDQYTTLEGYKEAPVINFNTLYRDYSFKVVAVMITNIKPEQDNGYVFPYFWTNLNSALNYTAYLNQLSQRSLYDTGVNVLPTDRLLTLSTCYSEFDDARLVVVARLVRPGESKTVDTSKAVENPNPRFPQAYYDEHKLTNPYKGAYQWKIT